MTLLGHPVCVKPYLLLEIPHLLVFFVCFWDDRFKKLHELYQGTYIVTAIVLGALYMVCKLLQTLSELG